MSSNPIKRDFSKNQIKILKLLLEKDFLQNELQEALNTTAPNLHYHLSRLESHNLIQKETLHEVGSAKINKISLNPSARENVRKILGYKNKKSIRNNASVKKSGYKAPNRASKKLKNNYYQISIVVFLLCLTGIIVSSSLLFFTPLKSDSENSEVVELTANADIFTQKTKTSNINVYDGTGATPFLRLGLYEFTYDAGGYLSEMYVRFDLSEIEKLSSMILRLTYWEGYPIEADNNYEVNASLVSNNWIEEDTVWTERPEYLGSSTLIHLHNPSLKSEIDIDLTSLVDGITATIITIHLCPHDLSRIRFPAPFKSSESYGITPRLILEYTTTSEPMIPNTTHIILIILLVVFGSLTTITLSGIIYKRRKHEVREIPAVIVQDSAMPLIIQESLVSLKQEKSVSMKTIRKMKKTALLSALLAIIFTVLGVIIIMWGMSVG
jgi:DNA-binding MarR family transcriptional regulator